MDGIFNVPINVTDDSMTSNHIPHSGHRVGDGWQVSWVPGEILSQEPRPRHHWRGTYRAAVTAMTKSMIAWRAAGLNPRIARS